MDLETTLDNRRQALEHLRTVSFVSGSKPYLTMWILSLLLSGFTLSLLAI